MSRHDHDQGIPFEAISGRNTAASLDDNVLFGADAEKQSCGNGEPGSLGEALPLNTLSHDRITAGTSPSDFSRQFDPLPKDPARQTPVGPATSLESHQQRLVAPSGLAGAFVGLLLGGPFIATIAGLGAAYAVRKDGATGDAARALGEVALSVQSKGEELENNYHIWSNTKRAIQDADSKIVLEARSLLEKGWDSAVELNRQHNLLERGVEATGHGLEYVAEKIQAISHKTPVAPATSLDSYQQRLVAPSGIAGAFVGLLLGGPIIATIAGLGAAYAVRKDGATGDAARALGEVALSVQSKGEELENNYHIWSDTKRAIQDADSKIVLEARSLLEKGWDSSVELNRQHNLLERGVEATGHGLEYVAEKIQAMSHKKERENQQGDDNE